MRKTQKRSVLVQRALDFLYGIAYRNDFDLSQYGGAPMLGLNGLVVKSHGSSKSNEIKNSIIQCIAFKEEKISEKIAANIAAQERI